MNKNMLPLILNLLLLAISPGLGKSAGILTEDNVNSSEPESTDVFATRVPVLTMGPAAAPSAVVAKQVPITFYMHDILGGSGPSDRVVAGIVANTQAKTDLPFAKRNGAIFPPNGGIPLVTVKNGGTKRKNYNNLPTFTGLKGQNPQESTLERLIFGAVTVINDELTEGQELGSSVIGKAQGFYLYSSEDGTSHTMAFTTLFGDHEEDSISFFGVHRTATEESYIAVVGGTGKFANAQGYAVIQTLRLDDQYTTDGVDTIIQFRVYPS